MVFSVPGGFGGSQGVFSSRAGVFSVPRFGFAVPGMVCWAPVGVFCSRNGVSGSRPEGTAWRCLWFPYGVSGSHACSSPSSLLFRCFFVASSLLLLASLLSFASLLPCFLASFLPSTFPPLLPYFLSFFFPFLRSCLPPSFPASSCPSFNLFSVLPFLASFSCFLFLLPFLASFPSLPFPNSLPSPSLPSPSLP